MKKSKHIIAMTMLLTLSINVQAHKRWILPSLFNVSEEQWVVVDATVSNNIFFADKPWPLTGITVTTPDGKTAQIENQIEGHRRSSFDFLLNMPGTYKITSGGDVFFAQYTMPSTSTGKATTENTRGFDFTQLKARLPENAKDITFAKSISRLESYVTLGAPTLQVFNPEKTGIELVPVTHPNDLYHQEKAKFQFLVNGEKVAGIKVMMVWEGTRHRNDEAAVTLMTDKNGEVSIDLNQTGRFLLEVSHQIDLKDDDTFSKLFMSYFGTFEVLPQ
jgi:uncharacterized GH25 family protein